MRLANIDQIDVITAANALRELGGRDLGNLIRLRHGRLRRDATELIVVDQLLDLVCTAGGAIRILAQPNGSEAHAQRVDEEQSPNEGLADAEYELDPFGGLDRSDETGQHAEHAAFGAARNEPGRRRLGEETAIARSLLESEDRCLSLETEDRPVDVGLAQQYARVVREIARREVIGAVDDDVVVANDVERVLGGETRLVGLDVDVRIHVANTLSRRLELGTADVFRAMQHLPLQVRNVDDIEIDEAERADACRGEIERERGAKRAGADEQDASRFELALPVDADVRKDEVPAVAQHLLIGQRGTAVEVWHRVILRQSLARS